MAILFVSSADTQDNIKALLHDNHRLYAHLNKYEIKYTDSIWKEIDFVYEQKECLILSELSAFINPIIDYRSFVDADNYIYLISKGKPHSIHNTYNSMLISVISEWTKLFLQDWKKYNVPIIDYISMRLSLDTTTEVELQNIKLLTCPFSMSIQDISKYQRIPTNVLLTNIYDTSTDIMTKNIIGINTHLGIYYGNI